MEERTRLAIYIQVDPLVPQCHLPTLLLMSGFWKLEVGSWMINHPHVQKVCVIGCCGNITFSLDLFTSTDHSHPPLYLHCTIFSSLILITHHLLLSYFKQLYQTTTRMSSSSVPTQTSSSSSADTSFEEGVAVQPLHQGNIRRPWAKKILQQYRSKIQPYSLILT
jgi:hypothetical protein